CARGKVYVVANSNRCGDCLVVGVNSLLAQRRALDGKRAHGCSLSQCDQVLLHGLERRKWPTELVSLSNVLLRHFEGPIHGTCHQCGIDQERPTLELTLCQRGCEAARA